VPVVSPPNVLLITVDDQRPDTIGALGHDDVETPTLDSLVREGTFVRPYTTVPVCTPGRSELVSGCDAFENGCRWFGESIDDSITLLPEAFGDAGYRTRFAGKWHVHPGPREAGFDETRRIIYDEIENDYPECGHRLQFSEDGEIVEGHSTDLVAEAAEHFVRAGAKEDQPWLAYVGFHSPHDPRTPPEEFAYDPAEVDLPENYMPEHPFDNGEMTIRDEQLEEFPRTREAIREHLADYYGMISHHDAAVGRLLDRLEETGQREDTLVVFTSDHGLAIGSHGLMGKENCYEHSTRVPMVAAGPDIAADRRPGALCGQYDLYPTLCDLAGIEVPESVTGRSYASLLRGETDDHREEIVCAYRDVQRMIRTDRFKLIRYPETGHEQLFDLETDPDELVNLLDGWRRRFLENREDVHESISEWTASTDTDPWAGPPPVGADTIDAAEQDLRERLRAWQEAVDDPLAAE
jgi:arylsulfatase A-like enzyme